MDTDIFCVLCGGPFDLEHHVYNIDPDRDDFQWLYHVRLLGTLSALHNHRMTTAGEWHSNESGTDDVFLSETIRWSMTDADCFRLGDSFYRVLAGDENGDVVFPLHDSCIQLGCRLLEHRHDQSSRSEGLSTLTFLHHTLRNHFEHAKVIGPDLDHDILTLGASCEKRGPRSILALDQLGWWSGAYEKFLTDPIVISDPASFIVSTLKSTPRETARRCGKALHPQPHSGLEALPNELLDRITDLLPAPSVVSLNRCSRLLNNKVPLNDRFYRHHLSNGSLVPHLWDLNEEALKYLLQEAPANISWDWQSLVRLLKNADRLASTTDNDRGYVPDGLWNRSRIWSIIDEACSQPRGFYKADSAISHQSQSRSPPSEPKSLLVVSLVVAFAATIAWDLRWLAS